MAGTVIIAGLSIGSGHPVRVESMLKIPLSSREECLEQCRSLASSGCELIRAAFPSPDLGGDLAWLNEKSPVPLMADIHFDPALALEPWRRERRPSGSTREIWPGPVPRRLSLLQGEKGSHTDRSQRRITEFSPAGESRRSPFDPLAAAVEEQLLILMEEGFEI